MSLKRTSTCVLLVGLGGAVGCTRYPTLKTVPIECSAEDGYEFKAISGGYWWGSGDNTLKPDASLSAVRVETSSIADAGFQCGSTAPLQFYASHNNDWGALYGCSGFAMDASDYQGISFWARAPVGTSNGFTIWLDDPNTAAVTNGYCKAYTSGTDGGSPGYTTPSFYDPTSNTFVSGESTSSKLPDQCGNGYSTVMVVATDWRFYTIPFSQLMQSALPNRVPNSLLTHTGSTPGTTLLTSAITGIGMRLPSEAQMELWMDKLSFYRKKGAGADAGAGVDAAAGPVGSGGSTGGTGGAPAGTGGSSGSTPSDGVACPLPTQALITDFTNRPEDGGTTDSTTLVVGEHAYPTSGQYMVTSDVSQGNWHISGNLGDYSGFGLDLLNCSRIDASAYRGIQFTISGSVPQGNMVTFGVGTLNNAISSDWLISHGDTTAKAGDPGRCLPISGANRYSQPTCSDAKKDIPVTAVPTPVKVLWSDFTGGKPEPGVTASDIISIYWYFPNPTGVGTASVVPYPADIVIDDLQFITP